MPHLHELEIGEVSLVDKAANRRKFLVLKSEDQDMPKEMVVTVEPGLEAVIKAIADTAGSKAIVEALAKADMSEKGKLACRAALRALESAKDELPKDIMQALATAGGYEYPQPQQKAAEDEQKMADMQKAVDEAKDKVCKLDTANKALTTENAELRKAAGKEAKKPFMKADGSPDYDAIPAEMRPMIEALWKASDTNAKANAELREALTKAETEAESRTFITKAAGFPNLPIKAEELGPLLHKISKALSAEEMAAVDKLLVGLNEGMSAVFKEAGSGNSGGHGGAGTDAERQLDVKAVEIAKRDKISKEAAYVKAMDEYPDLAARERKERDDKVAAARSH